MLGEFKHHAYVLVGEREAVAARLREHLAREWQVELENNPDVSWESYESLSIRDSRLLREQQSGTGWQGRRLWVVSASAIPVEAQNALLKTLEEPQSGHHFFFIVPTLAMLIPTFVSRCHVVHVSEESSGRKEKTGEKSRAEVFLRATPEERLHMVGELLKSNEDHHKQAASALLRELEVWIACHFAKLPQGVTWQRGVSELTRAHMYLNDKAAAPRVLLEHVSLVLPQITTQM